MSQCDIGYLVRGKVEIFQMSDYDLRKYIGK